MTQSPSRDIGGELLFRTDTEKTTLGARLSVLKMHDVCVYLSIAPSVFGLMERKKERKLKPQAMHTHR